ncbi:hypothetical protein FALBO_8745 [Fusarium albosuccineum]|uniref:Uncharacterized protein n=1 Tax=Fusarium albosuccineum TaxID=1237068 RepID=A0A8H4LAM9_9HYPO|nr:hypothetical protein FALBO_8745 [Fusarium albosuccineum]
MARNTDTGIHEQNRRRNVEHRSPPPPEIKLVRGSSRADMKMNGFYGLQWIRAASSLHENVTPRASEWLSRTISNMAVRQGAWTRQLQVHFFVHEAVSTVPYSTLLYSTLLYSTLLRTHVLLTIPPSRTLTVKPSPTPAHVKSESH